MTAYNRFTNYLWENGISLEFLMDALNPRDVSFMETTIKMMKMCNDDVFYDAAVRIVERALSNLEMLNSAYGIQNKLQ